jgi:hypothetical protein
LAGITLDGGGVFTTAPTTRSRTSIADNHPNGTRQAAIHPRRPPGVDVRDDSQS